MPPQYNNDKVNLHSDISNIMCKPLDFYKDAKYVHGLPELLFKDNILFLDQDDCLQIDRSNSHLSKAEQITQLSRSKIKSGDYWYLQDRQAKINALRMLNDRTVCR